MAEILLRSLIDTLIRVVTLMFRLGTSMIAIWFRRKFAKIPAPFDWTIKDEALAMTVRSILKTLSYAELRYLTSSLSQPTTIQKLFPAHVRVRALQDDPAVRGWVLELAYETKPAKPGGKVARLNIIYWAGGAFVMGHPLAWAKGLVMLLEGLHARGVDARILAAQYPWAPEHPFPAATISAVSTYDWVVANMGHDVPIVVMGDSAGANLCLSAAAVLRDGCPASWTKDASPDTAAMLLKAQALPCPLAAVLICPWLDLTGASCINDSEMQEACWMDTMTADFLNKCAQMYQPLGARRKDPLVSPLYLAPLGGLTRGGMLVLEGEAELMKLDTDRFVTAARGQGVALTYHVEPGALHDYPMYPGDKQWERVQGVAQYLAATAMKALS